MTAAKWPASFSLQGKTAVVTGAGSGIGRSIARRLAEAGGIVICTDRERADAEATSEEITALGAIGRAMVLDVSAQDSVTEFWDELDREEVALDVLVNNAGISPVPVRLHEITDTDWARCIDVNLSGVFRCTRRALTIMLKRRSGSIVNIASVAGMRGFYPGFAVLGAAYSATKAGVIGLTRQAAAEYAADNIRVNVIAPGWIGGTRLGDARRAAASSAENERFVATLSERIPARRFGTTDEIANLTLFLATSASSYLTGQVIAHDGCFAA
jgi:NAD(P)-dependent dehydrogenase (short-subunit alcohol dehydrogenase family)